MGKRSNRAAARRVRQDRALAPGMTKGLLDKLHAAALERYGVGIGVVVQEEERAGQRVASLTAERDALSFFAWDERRKLNRAVAAAEAERDVWAGRMRELAALVADDADSGKLLELFRAGV